MLAIYDQIQELRAELGCYVLTRAERVDALKMIEKLIAEQAGIDHILNRDGVENRAPG